MRDGVAESWRALRQVFSRPDLRRLQLALAGSVFAGWAFGIAFAIYGYRVGGAAGASLALVVRVLPAAVFAPLAGVIVDRHDRRLVMLAADLLSAAAIALAAALVMADAPAGLVFALAGVHGALQSVSYPGRAAILPGLARTPEELTAANAVATTVGSIAMLAGPALGGVLVAVTGVEVVFLVTVAGLLASAAMLARITPQPRPAAVPGVHAESLLKDAAEGFGVVGGEPRVRLLVGLYAAQTLVSGALNVLIVVMALELFDSGPAGVGLLTSAMAVGSLLGGFGALGLAGRRLAPAFAAGLVLWGVPLALIGIVPQEWAAVLLLLALGAGDPLVDVATITLLQRAVPESVLARVFGVLEGLLMLTVSAGALLAPVLVAGLGIRGALVATGTFLPVLAVVTWTAVRRIDARSEAPSAGVELLRGLPIFAPLPPAALERLAGRLQRVAVAPGHMLFAQGDPGTRFYVIAAGEVDIRVDGRDVRRQGAGEGFGEIALLRDTPRTASAVAATDAELYALDRADFAGAVTGHPESLGQADAIVAAGRRHARPAFAVV